MRRTTMGGTGRQPHVADGIRMLERRRRRLPALRLRGEDGSLALGCGVHWSGMGPRQPRGRALPPVGSDRSRARRSLRGGRRVVPSGCVVAEAVKPDHRSLDVVPQNARPGLGARSQGTLAVRASVGTCLGRNCGRPAMRRGPGAAHPASLDCSQQVCPDPNAAVDLRPGPRNAAAETARWPHLAPAASPSVHVSGRSAPESAAPRRDCEFILLIAGWVRSQGQRYAEFSHGSGGGPSFGPLGLVALDAGAEGTRVDGFCGRALGIQAVGLGVAVMRQ